MRIDVSSVNHSMRTPRVEFYPAKSRVKRDRIEESKPDASKASELAFAIGACSEIAARPAHEGQEEPGHQSKDENGG